LLFLVGILFYLHFKTPAKKEQPVRTAGVTAANNGSSRLAYFVMDSIENSFSMVKDIKSELNRQEDAINNELSRMERDYRNKAAQYQAQAQAGMNQTQSELAQRDMMQTQQAMQARKQELEQKYQDYQMRKLKEVRTTIEDFLKDYNKTGAYSYIVSDEPGLFYFKDSAFNITGDVINGLNSRYTKKK
jgi:outer membrane protein